MTNETAYAAGYAAWGLEGLNALCPYVEGTEEYFQWNYGLFDAQHGDTNDSV